MSRRIKPKEKYVRISNERNWAQFGRSAERKKRIYVMFWNLGAGRSSEVERSLMVRWVVGSILHGVDPLSYFSF